MLAGAEYHNDQRVALTVVAGVSLLVTFGSLRGSLAPLFSAETFLPTLVRLVSATLIHLSVPCLTLLHSRRLGLIVAVCIVVLSVGVGEGLFGVNSTSQLPLPLPLINSVRRANELLQTEGFKVSVPLGPFYEYGIYSLMAWGVAAELGLIYERHLRSQHRALNDATERIRQKSSVLSRVSHELRTPTTAIVSWTELLLIDKTMSEDTIQEVFQPTLEEKMEDYDSNISRDSHNCAWNK
ncbi:hypothetical protein GQ42DRAFT_152038 [Ramicandelaber brevisporus]|nr:hypothetical protein GQ42DRAFT_152038 [Ramicandelaber brevisporus]